MAGLTTWSPFRSLGRREDVFDDFFRDVFRREAGAGVLEPSAEIAESDGEVTVKLEVPGVTKDDIHVTVDDDTVTVRGETRKETEEKKKSYYRQEIRYGAFQRTVPLPVEVDSAKTTAKLENGMLTVTMPKAAHAKTKRVDVAVK